MRDAWLATTPSSRRGVRPHRQPPEYHGALSSTAGLKRGTTLRRATNFTTDGEDVRASGLVGGFVLTPNQLDIASRTSAAELQCHAEPK